MKSLSHHLTICFPQIAPFKSEKLVEENEVGSLEFKLEI